MLSPYPELVRAGFRRHSTYRQAALAGLVTNLVFGLLRVAVLVAVLAEAWAQAVLAWTPFPALIQIPIDVFIEQGPTGAALASQAAWAVVLLAFGRLVLRRGAAKLVVQGG